MLPGVERKWQRDRDGWQQLLRLSAAPVFILPLFARIRRIGVRAPIVMFVVEQHISCERVCVKILSDIFSTWLTYQILRVL